jgi:sodium transport system permease protein
MVFTALVLPPVLLFFSYAFIGRFALRSILPNPAQGIVYALFLPDPIREAAGKEGIFIIDINETKPGLLPAVQGDISGGKADLLMVFPPDFEEALLARDPASNAPAQAVLLYYNSASVSSTMAYSRMVGILETYESSLVNKFDVNPGDGPFDLAGPKDALSRLFAGMFPMVILVFLYSSSMTVAAESLAGEKERGTFTAIFVSPLRTGELAAGKVFSLASMAFLCGLTSFLGVFAGMGFFLADAGLAEPSAEPGFSLTMYGPLEFLLLIPVLLSTVFLFIVLVSIISALAKSVKEANFSSIPLVIIILLLGLLPLMGKTPPPGTCWPSLIPIYNSARNISAIFAFNYSPVEILLQSLVNILLGFGGIVILSRMFGSEKIMFGGNP